MVQKECPNCSTKVAIGCRKCTSCGHEFPFKKSQRKKKDEVKLQTAGTTHQVDFVAGIAADGALVLLWPKTEEFITLTPTETAVVDRALVARDVALEKEQHEKEVAAAASGKA